MLVAGIRKVNLELVLLCGGGPGKVAKEGLLGAWLNWKHRSKRRRNRQATARSRGQPDQCKLQLTVELMGMGGM